ncbi:MAG: hypothetical protein NTX25_00375 [Proteobacteria bacterium]|nr:hypothetical protein [Pseudomonadota bacterium]
MLRSLKILVLFMALVTVQADAAILGEDSSLDQDIQNAQSILRENFGLPQIKFSVESGYLKQVLDNERPLLSLSQATQGAMSVVFSEHADVESPLNIALSTRNGIGQGLSSHSMTRVESARQLLKQNLNQSTSQLSLYTGTEESGFPPENGEDIRQNWVFILQIPSLSDHIFWVIVDKSGLKQPYVYGFN